VKDWEIIADNLSKAGWILGHCRSRRFSRHNAARQDSVEGDSPAVEAHLENTATPVAQASSGVAVALPSQGRRLGDVRNHHTYRTANATYNPALG